MLFINTLSGRYFIERLKSSQLSFISTFTSKYTRVLVIKRNCQIVIISGFLMIIAVVISKTERMLRLVF